MKMKTLHISIIIAAAVAAVVIFGVMAALTPHLFQFNQQSNLGEAESELALVVSMNSTDVKVGQGMGMNISLTNTSPNTLVVVPKHDWPLRQWSMGPCLFHLPFGMALFRGDYTIQNMTEGHRLPLYPRGVYMCKTIGIVDYVFEPSSNKATV